MFKFIFIILVGLISIMFVKSKTNLNGFFSGKMEKNKEPGLWTITFSQVTTWIFSRSLLTAAILAFYYGLPGAIAYTTYYLSFLTGGYFVLKIRKKYNATSVVSFFTKEYGSLGKITYSFLAVLRLVSEIFANLIVVGLIFGSEKSLNYNLAILLTMGIAFSYSITGGFRNSIKTDFIQTIIFLLLMIILLFTISTSLFDQNITNINLKLTNYANNPAYALIFVALLQVWSYPLHDPVMMDRGFVCSEQKTKKSFIYACLISTTCIFLFACLGIILSSEVIESVSFIESLQIFYGEPTSTIICLLLIVSSISTLDSTLSSSAKLVVMDLKLLKKNIFNGRLIMFLFMLIGLVFILLNTKDLFTAVAVSGTAATFLTTTFVLRAIFDYKISKESLLFSFILSIAGSILYYLESQGINNFFSDYFNIDHKYKTLLAINLFIIGASFASAFSLVKYKNRKYKFN